MHKMFETKKMKFVFVYSNQHIYLKIKFILFEIKHNSKYISLKRINFVN